MNYAVIIAAGGSGTRMGLPYNKLFYPLKDGRTILEHTIKIFIDDQRCQQIIIATNADDLSRMVNMNTGRVVLVNGGQTRQESVYKGLMAANEEVVLIHDGARPWLPKPCLDRLLEVMTIEDAAILALKAIETVKVCEDGYVTQTIPRESVMMAQTPQAFKTEILIKAHHMAMIDVYQATDDAQLIEHYKLAKIKIVEGDVLNVKITTLHDVPK
ncbi:MAG: 2-C-methyl-D-erythritol 4-phosphate cytidylyltransferase [Erysipelotrichaceae bacterium]|nr:MAG: 2-C-methyl-D-erythritol 4-phosphate [Erysipelotrichaceae bacterium]TXT19114.1 MAG: 2-C-methyl-D-erythritol 4-phosphate cytidylyltransferase [Erysipelotrichaceae bacterium]